MSMEATRLSDDELALEAAEALPNREAMSVLTPDPGIGYCPEPVICPLPPEVETA